LRRIGPLRHPLISRKEEEPVPKCGQNGTADRPAILVALQSVARGGEEIPRVEIAVPYEFEKVAVILVRARFRHRVNRGARMQAVLSRQGARFHFELL